MGNPFKVVTKKMQANKKIAAVLVERIYSENLPIEITLGKTVCFDQSIAGFENKQYLQDITCVYLQRKESLFNHLLNQVVLQVSLT